MTMKVNNTRAMFDTHEQRLKDLKWAFGLNRLSLRLMGMWPGDDEAKNLQGLLTNLRAPFMITSIFVFMVLPQMYALVKVFGELPLVIDNLMTSSAAFSSCFKLFFIWRSKRVLRPVIQSVSQDWLRPKSNWERKAMIREASRARIFTVSGYAILAGCYTGFAVAPLFGINIRIISNITDYGKKHLFVQSYFPYDYSKSPYFEITHMCQLMAGVFIGMSVSIPDNYFAALVFHVSAQFEILGHNMENMLETNKNGLKKSNAKKFSEKMGILVDRHVHLINAVTAIEYTFSYVILAQIFCMSVMVCCLGVQIISLFGNQTSLFQALTLFSTLFTLMMHTLVDCFACETLSLRSSGIFRDIYNSMWYTIPKQSIKDMIPIMVASYNSRRLTAGKLFMLSLSTYCGILKTSGGYISVLIAVNK